jgi:Type I phosphodiesterase / nucleotide pyrophosphatase
MHGARRVALLAVVAAACALAALVSVASHNAGAAQKASGCQLGNRDGRIKHVIYLQFDNTHLRRDVNGVPSDLEQMPHLLNFLKDNGTVLSNDHTILISHTAGGILSSLTGLYPDRNGQAVSNSYGYFAASGDPAFSSSFKYWTDTVDGSDDALPNMVGDGGQTAEPPWVSYTHAGCNVGGVSAANIELENTSTTASGDMTRVFGQGSDEWNEAAANPTLAQADFVGIAIHCALNAAPCQGNGKARPDDATIYPGSNDGYLGLFGAKYVNPAITGGQACVKATDGTNITNAAGNCGFPGFDGALAKNTLGEVAQMQENGVPVTFAYISDAHDNHQLGRASGPGEADYKKQLADYDAAFDTFFTRLKKDGIDKSNTLFVVTVDEGDHFVGGPGLPDPNNPGALAYDHTNCLTVPDCPSNQIGEVNVNIKSALPAEAPFSIHNDDAPTFYVNGNPTRNDPTVRKLGQDLGTLQLPDPYKHATVPAMLRLADSVEEQTLHMVTSDPKRTPTLTMFGDDNFFFDASGNCKTSSTDLGVPICVAFAFAWNHGDFQDEIGNTWAGYVGPGVDRHGVDSKTWTDHTDLRPTMLALVGLHDDYLNDGRVVTQLLDNRVVPDELDGHSTEDLGATYKQLNAPFGQFAMDTLVASTAAVRSTDDLKYDKIESQIASLTVQRNDLANAIRDALNDAAAGGRKISNDDARDWIKQANVLLDHAQALAAANRAP